MFEIVDGPTGILLAQPRAFGSGELNIKALGHGFRQDLYLCKMGPRGQVTWPQGNNLNLEEVHEAMLHTKYQGSRPCGFRQDFFMVLPVSLCKTTPRQAIFNPWDRI